MIRPTVHVSSSKSTFSQIADSLSADIGKHVNVGLVGPKAQEQHGDSNCTNLQIGMFHEYGTSDIPARPWIAQSIQGSPDTLRGIRILAVQGLQRVIRGKVSKTAVLEMIGKFAAAGMKHYLLHGPHIPPPLAAVTVGEKAYRGNTEPERPLVDTKQMAAAISWQVQETGTFGDLGAFKYDERIE